MLQCVQGIHEVWTQLPLFDIGLETILEFWFPFTRWQAIMQTCKYVFVYRQIMPYIINTQYIHCTTPFIECFFSYARVLSTSRHNCANYRGTGCDIWPHFNRLPPKQSPSTSAGCLHRHACACWFYARLTVSAGVCAWVCVRAIHKVRILWGLICGCCRSSIYKWEIKMSTKLSPQTPKGGKRRQTRAHTSAQGAHTHTLVHTHVWGLYKN